MERAEDVRIISLPEQLDLAVRHAGRDTALVVVPRHMQA